MDLENKTNLLNVTFRLSFYNQMLKNMTYCPILSFSPQSKKRLNKMGFPDFLGCIKDCICHISA